jgi:hypothetical protein
LNKNIKFKLKNDFFFNSLLNPINIESGVQSILNDIALDLSLSTSELLFVDTIRETRSQYETFRLKQELFKIFFAYICPTANDGSLFLTNRCHDFISLEILPEYANECLKLIELEYSFPIEVSPLNNVSATLFKNRTIFNKIKNNGYLKYNNVSFEESTFPKS